MVQLRVRMIDAKRMLLRRDIVPEHQVKFIFVTAFSRNRRDGIVWFPIRLRKNKCCLIRIPAPFCKNDIRKLDDSVVILMGKTDNGHRPLDNTSADILKAPDRKRLLDRCLCHRKLIVAALEMVMAQDGTAHDRQIRIGAHKIVRELLHKIEKLDKRVMLNLHRNVLAVKHDAVLIVINIRRILESPLVSLNRHRDNPVVLSCRMVYASRIPLIFHAELALGISALFRILGSRDCLGILLRL